ncbi:hypothetical protein OSB04_016650 [Centaurea solstitialis]|uniref:Uncharacterized protein n=1 Tax=Centaurea solstitialis TaxID=347529 RepID=A0AA38WHM9_9ASTR|nr:hypothetical protein OSB04_016650 [Centaurea solstitialis]
MSTSTVEVEYVVAGSCCAQLLDYDLKIYKIPIYCDNTSAIAISNNPILHSKTKHIEIKYHFIRDHVMNGDIELHFILTEYQLADVFNKLLDETRFNILINKLEMATSSATASLGGPKFIIDVSTVRWKSDNFLPLFNLLEEHETAYGGARNFLRA